MKARFVFEKFEENSDPIKDMGIGMQRIYYYFYVSYPIINKLIDFTNPFHVKLVKWLQDYDGKELTPKDIYAVKKLIKKVELFRHYNITRVNKIHMPGVSKYYGPFITIRKGEFPDYETKGLYGRYSWEDVHNIDLNKTEHYEKRT